MSQLWLRQDWNIIIIMIIFDIYVKFLKANANILKKERQLCHQELLLMIVRLSLQAFV